MYFGHVNPEERSPITFSCFSVELDSFLDLPHAILDILIIVLLVDSIPEGLFLSKPASANHLAPLAEGLLRALQVLLNPATSIFLWPFEIPYQFSFSFPFNFLL